MTFYKTPPLVEFMRSNSSGDTLKLRRNMTYYIAGKTIVIPKGFSCDGMSVPRCLWSLVSPMIHPATIAAAILHDWLYRKTSHSFTRKQADQFFYLLMRKCKFSRWRAWLAYLGVRLFGGGSWAKGKKRDV